MKYTKVLWISVLCYVSLSFSNTQELQAQFSYADIEIIGEDQTPSSVTLFEIYPQDPFNDYYEEMCLLGGAPPGINELDYLGNSPTPVGDSKGILLILLIVYALWKSKIHIRYILTRPK